MVDSVGGKQPQTSVPVKPHHNLPVTPGFFAPALVTVISLPLGFLFALGIQGTPLSFVISITGFGLLTALDLKTGLLRAGLGSAVTFLTLSYILQNSSLLPGIAPSTGFSSLLVAIPPAVGVFFSTILFSRRQRYRILKQNVLATLSMGIGLIIGASTAQEAGLIGANLVSSSLFILLGLGGNCVQMMLLFFLDKFWQTKRQSMAVLPTAFFSYNAIVGYEYFTSQTSTLAYLFFSSLGFLPLLIIAGIGSSSIAVKMLKAPARPTAGPSQAVACFSRKIQCVIPSHQIRKLQPPRERHKQDASQLEGFILLHSTSPPTSSTPSTARDYSSTPGTSTRSRPASPASPTTPPAPAAIACGEAAFDYLHSTGGPGSHPQHLGPEGLGRPGRAWLSSCRPYRNGSQWLRSPRNVRSGRDGGRAEDTHPKDDPAEIRERTHSGNDDSQRDYVGGNETPGTIRPVKVCSPDQRDTGGPVERTGDHERRYCSLLSKPS